MNSPKLIAFFKGTAGDFNKLGPALAGSIMSAAADMRNHVSPFRATDCQACNGTGYIIVSNGPDDVDKESCQKCDGSGRVIRN